MMHVQGCVRWEPQLAWGCQARCRCFAWVLDASGVVHRGGRREATAAQEGGHRRAEDAEARVRALAGRVQELEGQLAVQRREHVAERAREADVHKDADRQRQGAG